MTKLMRMFWLFLGVAMIGSGADAWSREPLERREKRPKARGDNPCVDEDRIRAARNLIPQQFSDWVVRNARAALLPDGTGLRIFTEGPLIAILGNFSLTRLQPPLRVVLTIRTPNDLPVLFSWVEPSREDEVYRDSDESIIQLQGSDRWQTGSALLTPIEPVRSLRMLLPTSAPTPVDIARLVINDSVGRTLRFDFGEDEARPAWVNGGYLKVGED